MPRAMGVKQHGFHALMGSPLVQRGNMLVEDTTRKRSVKKKNMRRDSQQIRDADNKAAALIKQYGSWDQIPADNSAEYRMRERARSVQAEKELATLRERLNGLPDQQLQTLYQERDAMLAEIARLTALEAEKNQRIIDVLAENQGLRASMKTQPTEVIKEVIKPVPPVLEDVLDLLDRITARGWRLEKSSFTTPNGVLVGAHQHVRDIDEVFSATE